MTEPLSEDGMYELLDRIGCGVLSTIGMDGFPYGTPVNFVRIGDSIYFHGSKRGERMSNLEADPRCCLTVMVEGGYERKGDDACRTMTIFESVIVRGTVETVEDPGMKENVLRALSDKLIPGHHGDRMGQKEIDATGVYALRIGSMTGRHHRHRPEYIKF